MTTPLSDLAKKRFTDFIEESDYDSALKLAENLMEDRGDQEALFRLCVRSLSHLLSVKDSKKVDGHVKLFNQLFEFCFKCEQKLLTKNSICYYAIQFAKNLLALEKFAPGLKMLDRLQEIYTFICNNKYDEESEKYIKFLSPLSYNLSLNKELINQQPETAVQLFVHGIKFYTKIRSNFYILFDSVRVYELNFLKTKNFQSLYDSLFDFLYDSINTTEETVQPCTPHTPLRNPLSTPISKTNENLQRVEKTSTPKSKSPYIITKMELSSEDPNVAKHVYLRKFYLSLVLHYSSICFNNDLSREKQIIDQQVSKLSVCFSKKSMDSSINPVTQSKSDLRDLESRTMHIKLFNSIVKYLNQFKREVSKSSSSKSSTLIGSILTENVEIELQLKKDFEKLNSSLLKAQSFYQYWLANNLFELFYSVISNSYGLFDQAGFSKYLQESLIHCFGSVSLLYAENVKNIYKTHFDPDKIPKQMFFKPLMLFHNSERLVEQLTKTKNQTKTAHTELDIETCMAQIQNHKAFLNWLANLELLPAEELSKHFNSFENQSIRIASHFYSEGSSVDNYVQFQKLSLTISMERLKYLHKLNQLESSNLLKNFRGICDNLLLSQRLNEKYVESQEIIKNIFLLLEDIAQDECEMEWLVTLWCKIKRDICKSNSKKPTEAKPLSDMTIADLLDIKKSQLRHLYLLEEIRIYNCFKSTDVSVMMDDEIHFALERLEKLTMSGDDSEDDLLNCRIQMEIGQFCWRNYKAAHCVFKLKSSDYFKRAQIALAKHSCKNENKENFKSPQKNSVSKKRLSSPTDDIICLDQNDSPSAKKKAPKKRKIAATQSPSLKHSFSDITCDCDCLESKIISFQLILLRMLCEYTTLREKMRSNMANLMQSRFKMKESSPVLTNTDNLHMQTILTQFLICPDFCTENTLNMSDSELIAQLNTCLSVLEGLVNSKKCGIQSDIVNQVEKTLLKQLFVFIDLLAELFGFFGLVMNKCKTLKLKMTILDIHKNYEKVSTLNADALSLYSSTLYNLMKSYLNVGLYQEFGSLNKQILLTTQKYEKVIDEASSQASSEGGKVGTDDEFSLEMLKTLVEKNTFISSKPETLLSYYLVLTHYLILTNKYSDAIKVIKTKLIKSSILNKVKHTLIYFEAKYYFRYLQFLLSMKDIGKCDKDFQKVIENETPLSLLEECYSCVSSVARYHMENSVDLSRSLNNTHNKDNHENFFFNIGKAECYRILNESLNIMEVVCKYYIEISRYRDACGFIREGMDLTQLHFAPRRVTTFLLLQANADLVASCTIEAASRIKVAERIINDSNGKKILLTPTSRGPPKSTLNTEDLHNLKSYFYLNYLNHMKLLKETKQPDQTTTIDIQEIDQPGDEDIFRGLELIKSFIETNHQINEFCNDILIETYFLAYSIFKLRCHKAFMEQILAWIKSALFKSKKLTFSQENWHLAEYYCCVFEFNELFNFKETLKESDDQLKKAIVYIKANPHPTLYRRICFHLFKTENNVTRKVMLLLETQSIALRHKACAIQIKQMRKSSIESGIYEKLTSSLSFNEMDSQYLFNFVGRVLPSNSVAVALVLNNMNDLFIIRLERDCEPFFYELKYNQKYNESFKQIMIENDLSMKQTDRTKFWSTRNTLNKRLYKFLEDLESNVFTGVSKALLLGSYLNLDMKQLVRSFKRDLRIASLTESQERLISVVLLGIEYLTTSELTGALRQEFSDSQVDKFSDYLLVKKIDLAKEKRKHICLLIDKNLHQIPWECLPTTKDQLISRMPSIHFLQSHIQVTSLNINKDKTYYIVDPGSDLTHTREKFQTFFEKKKNWNGLVGVAPNEDQFKRALTEYELFIYTGHGSGSQYYPSDDVQKLRVQACSILMGCSSGNQYVMGDFEPYGTVLAYILAGCPCIVGNLWDVTDRDIDRLTEDFLDSWIKNHEDTEDMQSNSICFHLTKSRAACKMQYLNGSAPIVYGLPVNFK